MRNLSIPDNIQENIREYLMTVNDNKTQQNEMIEFLQTLKPRLKEKVCMYIFFVAITQNSLLKKLIETEKVTDYLKKYRFKQRELDVKLYEQVIYKHHLTAE